MTNENVSSAEVTAYMRSQKPNLTHDNLSHHLVSKAGIKKHHEFVDGMNYPLGTRKIMARAGFFYEQALQLLKSGHYDSCISLASGFSMLTSLLANQTSNVIYYDVDLPHMVTERKKRINEAEFFSTLTLNQTKLKAIDLTHIEQFNFQEVFNDCKRPLFILEGITYFLPPQILTLILQQITRFNSSAIILDYWPENSVEISAVFKRIVPQLKGFIAEDLNDFFLTAEQIDFLQKHYQKTTDLSILEVDELLSKQLDEPSVLTDQNDVFPIRIIVAS